MAKRKVDEIDQPKKAALRFWKCSLCGAVFATLRREICTSGGEDKPTGCPSCTVTVFEIETPKQSRLRFWKCSLCGAVFATLCGKSYTSGGEDKPPGCPSCTVTFTLCTCVDD
jgi:ribosomal protein L37AE/L43A